jgi:hypothetical protein
VTVKVALRRKGNDSGRYETLAAAQGLRVDDCQVRRRRLRLSAKLIADDVRFVFPGASSFGADINGKAGLVQCRFAAVHPTFDILDVMVSGPPWNTRMGVRMRDKIGEEYSNEGMHYLPDHEMGQGLLRPGVH